MVFIAKLFFSGATFGLGAGLALRPQRPLPARALTAAGLLLAWGGAVVLGSGYLGLDLPLRPAYWVLRATGGPGGAGVALAVHLSLGVATLLAYHGWSVLLRMGHRWAPRLPAPLLGCWIVWWVAAMFGWV